MSTRGPQWREHGRRDPAGRARPAAAAAIVALRYAWALPTTAVGLTVLAVSAAAAPVAGRVRTRVVDGVVEVYGGLVDVLLRRATLLPNGASAMTLGHVVLGRDAWALDLTRDHERIHVRQVERWGPLFLPAYGLASLLVAIRGGNAYLDNPFEREAYGVA